MKQEIIIKMKLKLCDRNKNFGEILETIYETIKERDGVEKIEILEKDYLDD